MQWTFNGINPWVILRNYRKGDLYWIKIWLWQFTGQSYLSLPCQMYTISKRDLEGKIILRLTWGKRKEYPSYIYATKGMYLTWFKQQYKLGSKVHSVPETQEGKTMNVNLEKKPNVAEKIVELDFLAFEPVYDANGEVILDPTPEDYKEFVQRQEDVDGEVDAVTVH